MTQTMRDQLLLNGFWSTGNDFAEIPAHCEVDYPSELSDPDRIASDIGRIDWSFTSDDTTYLSHDIHPYPAKFIPQIPSNLIARLSLRGDLVLDPFCGSGTTALEAVRLGRRAIGVDANPVGILAGKVKTTQLGNADIRDLHGLRSALRAQLTRVTDDAAQLITEYSEHIPDIPNRTKWFPDTSCGEMAMIRSYACQLETEAAKNIALLAISKSVLKASNQDSETRYVSKPKEILPGDTLKNYLRAIDGIIRDVNETESTIRYGVSSFIEADMRLLADDQIPNESIDLVVTSPPYGNAMDYHLYHRFRLFWLGYDPRKLAKIEIGSHLRHQKETTGFDSYAEEMGACVNQLFRVLKSGRYAAFVIGDSVYEGKKYDGGKLIARVGQEAGFEQTVIVPRKIHKTRRSFAAGRRATDEWIVVLRKPSTTVKVTLDSPPYRLWPYEKTLRKRELEKLSEANVKQSGEKSIVQVDSYTLPRLRRATFCHRMQSNNGNEELSWQAMVENGLAASPSARKDPKYITHGIHPYKGKFYPQLAKSLMNISEIRPGGVILDPFCGSGTTLLEGYLNGYSTRGCDLNPLAAKIASAKVGILEVDPTLVCEAAASLLDSISNAPSTFLKKNEQFSESSLEEIESWFPKPVIWKLNWLLQRIRSVSAATVSDFFEVILSSIIRDISHQDPRDLRIRRRKEPLNDADVLGGFRESLEFQLDRLNRFWSVRGYSPFQFHHSVVRHSDSREWLAYEHLGLDEASVDLVLTSPPYATALPYIDTYRLSLLVLFGMTAKDRRPTEVSLIGSREIARKTRCEYELLLAEGEIKLPDTILRFVGSLISQGEKTDIGFRRQNMPALLLRFFIDMQRVFENTYNAMRPGAEAMIVMGDNITTIGAKQIPIRTTRFVAEIAQSVGLQQVETIPITVTTDNSIHAKNSIKENGVLRFHKPG